MGSFNAALKNELTKCFFEYCLHLNYQLTLPERTKQHESFPLYWYIKAVLKHSR